MRVGLAGFAGDGLARLHQMGDDTGMQGMSMSTDDLGSHGDRVKLRILETGVRLWLADPSYVTARRIGQELGLTHGAVLHYFKQGPSLSDAVAYYAVQQGESRIIAQLIATRHRHVAHLPEADKLEHMRLAV